MIEFILLLVGPLVIAIGALIIFKGKITIAEFTMQAFAPALLAGIFIGTLTYSKMEASEIWNSQITSRDRTRVSCSHSYPCRCRTVSSGSGKSRSTSTVCDTCYEHPYDVDWSVSTSSNETLDIDREDSQGLIMPERWKQAYVGEPFSSQHNYTNYLLLNSHSVMFGGQGDVQRFKDLIPHRPAVYDEYRFDHVMVTPGLPVDTKTWNWLLNEVNKQIGPTKQVNVLVVIAKTTDPSYVQALKSAWKGGEKNDLIVVIGTPDGHQIAFTDVISWTPREDLKVELRDQIQNIGSLDQRDLIVKAIQSQVSLKFQRMHMKQYKYMLASVELSTRELLLAFILCILLEMGITFWVVRNQYDLQPQFTT